MAIMIDREPRHLGGEQVYFRCPNCGARRHHLYVRGSHALCRRCAPRLSYRSKHDHWFPAVRRAAKLRARLGGLPGLGAPLPKCPHSVRHDYYKMWIAELVSLEAQALAALGKMNVALERRQKGLRNAKSKGAAAAHEQHGRGSHPRRGDVSRAPRR
jgi:hypothetical protein